MVDNSYWQDKKVLVTGHTGFKGGWLSHWLLELGANVAGYGLEPDSFGPVGGSATTHSLFDGLQLSERMSSTFADINDAETFHKQLKDQRPEVIFHLAAQPLVRRGYKDPAETFATNIIGTVNLLESVRALDLQCHIVVVTSDKCYFNREMHQLFTEEDPLGGKDPYSASKACADIITQSYWHSYFSAPDSGVRIATARAGNVVGGGDWASDRLLPDLVRSRFSGASMIVRNPSAIRPWQHVLEPLSGYIMLAEQMSNPELCRPWNFGPSEEETRNVSEVIGLVKNHWQDIDVRDAGQPSHPEAGILMLNSEAARTSLNWYQRWNLDETMVRTLDWYQAWNEGADVRQITTAQLQAYRST